MERKKLYSLEDLETLRKAARLCESASNAYSLEDLQILAAAGDVLDVQIPELPRILPALLKPTASSLTVPGRQQNSPQAPPNHIDENVSEVTNVQEISGTPPRAILPESNPIISQTPHSLNVMRSPRQAESVLSHADPSVDVSQDADGNTAAILDLLADSSHGLSSSWPFDSNAPYQHPNARSDMSFFDVPSCVDDANEYDLLNDWEDIERLYGQQVAGGISQDASNSLVAQPSIETNHFDHNHTEVEFGSRPIDVHSDDSGSSSRVIYTPPSGSDGSTSEDKESRRWVQLAAKSSPGVERNTRTAGTSNKSALKVLKLVGSARQKKVCIRCRMQKLKCERNPRQPHGPCLQCSTVVNSIYRIPCLRHMITDCILFRTSVYNYSWYEKHPMIGDKYGDFHMRKTWTEQPSKILRVTQDRGLTLDIHVREFEPPDTEGLDPVTLLASDGRPMYAIPWAVRDPDFELRKLQDAVFASVECYLDALLDDTNRLVWDVFHSAYRMSIFPNTNQLLQDVLRLWTAQRLIESKWRCCGNDNINAEAFPNMMYGLNVIAIPPYINYQYFSIVMHRLLGPLRTKVLRQLQTLIKDNKSSNWYTIFLTCFILLHSYELQMTFIYEHARRRNASVRYIYMGLVRAISSGAKTILAHFHYCLKGQTPFDRNFDWNSSTTQNMARLDKEQLQFMESLVKTVHEHEGQFRAIKDTDHYDEPYWFISQLFEKNWTPRETNEHSPLFENG